MYVQYGKISLLEIQKNVMQKWHFTFILIDIILDLKQATLVLSEAYYNI